MTTLVVALVLGQPALGGLDRDAYGTPIVTSPSSAEAFELMGKAVAQDRLWQMEMSRRSARGRLSEVLGPAYVAADEDVLRQGYTDDELQAQFDAMPASARSAWQAYARGVNSVIEVRRNETPPTPGIERYELQPWTVLDSAAIAVQLGWRFGSGGAGELRNWLGYLYLKSQPVGTKALDVMDDLLWWSDPKASSTIKGTALPDGLKGAWTRPSREATLKHLARLPSENLFDLLPAVRVADMSAYLAAAEGLGSAYKTGSYAVAVGRRRSTTGRALLLTGPQMGHRKPSVAHEIVVRSPGYTAAGMDVPGIPGVLLGHGPNVAWGLTTSAVDTSDIVWSDAQELKTLERTFKVLGGDERRVVRKSTLHGPVVLQSARTGKVYSIRRSYAGKELQGFASVLEIPTLASVDQVLRLAERVPLGFNLLSADSSGSIAYATCGRLPKRAPGWNPRFPIPSDAALSESFSLAQWVRTKDPVEGVLTNWNNRPVGWLPDFDTPAWSGLSRVELIERQVGSKMLGMGDLEQLVWAIARQDAETLGAFAKWFPSDLWALGGDPTAGRRSAFVNALRDELFKKPTGGFLNDSFFRTVVQPAVVLRALERKTRYDWLAARSPNDVIEAARKKAEFAAPYVAPPIRYEGLEPVPYSNRGTYLQIVELGTGGSARSVLGPGAAESGEHEADQVPLVREGRFKPLPAGKTGP